MAFVGTSYTRVEDHTAPRVNDRIEARTGGETAYYADHPEEIDERLAELDREWDVERWLQLNSAALSLLGLGMAVLGGKRRWLLLPVAVQAFFLQHGVQGWCPPLPAFRRMGVRTMREIEAERNALKALRGDFEAVRDDPAPAIRVAFDDADPANDGQVAGVRSDGTARRRLASTPTRLRVIGHTSDKVNRKIEHQAKCRVSFYARDPRRARERLKELDREWDIERVIEVEAPSLTLGGIALGTLVRPAWMAVPLTVQTMMLLHAWKGFYPMMPIFRRLGVRTAAEISAERTAILAALGEFEHDGHGRDDQDPSARGIEALESSLSAC